MKTLRNVAIDCMGGDYAPDIVIHGLAIAAPELSEFRFTLFGDSNLILQLADKYGLDKNIIDIVDSKGTQVDATMKPSYAIRNALHSSMGLAVTAVRDKKAEACISAGNTGAYMGLAKVILKTIPGVQRPAIASIIPTQKKPFVMLDLGANAECSATNLVEFAMLGDAFAKAALHVSDPSVAILNIGSEENKGCAYVKDAFVNLKTSNLINNFTGFIEGDKLFEGNIDVVVSDGFCGNITLKVIEGCAKFILSEIKQAFLSTILSKVIGLLSSGFLKNKLMNKLDPRMYNGAILLGVNGVVVKSHGGTDHIGFANAIKFTSEVVRNNLVNNTTAIMSQFVKDIALES